MMTKCICSEEWHNEVFLNFFYVKHSPGKMAKVICHEVYVYSSERTKKYLMDLLTEFRHCFKYSSQWRVTSLLRTRFVLVMALEERLRKNGGGK